MQEGILETTLLDSGSLADADFDLAIKEGRINEMLAGLGEPRLKLRNKNLVFDHWVPYSYYWGGWSSAGSPPGPFHQSAGSGHSYLGFICLLNYTSEPTYTEYSGEEHYWDPIHTAAGSVDTSAGAKRFEEDQIEQWVIWSDAGGKEKVSFRNRWLYLPNQAVSSVINSLGVFFHDDATSVTSSGREFSRAARIRFKDSGGNPITINKTGNQVLLIEYTFSLISV